jgi:hypothetical protein
MRKKDPCKKWFINHLKMKNLTFFFFLLFFTPVLANNLDNTPLVTIQNRSISIKDALISVEKQSKVHIM